MKNNKGRILALADFFQKETDCDHFASTAEIIQYLEQKGYSADRHTLKDDIEALVEFGMDIKCVKSNMNYYYMVSRLFERAELKLLADAVVAVDFLSEKSVQELVRKLFLLNGKHEAKILEAQMENKKNPIYAKKYFLYILDCFVEAIYRQKKIGFSYCEKMNQKNYAILPKHLYLDDKKYYVKGIVFDEKEEKSFRLDLIEDPTFL